MPEETWIQTELTSRPQSCSVSALRAVAPALVSTVIHGHHLVGPGCRLVGRSVLLRVGRRRHAHLWVQKGQKVKSRSCTSLQRPSGRDSSHRWPSSAFPPCLWSLGALWRAWQCSCCGSCVLVRPSGPSSAPHCLPWGPVDPSPAAWGPAWTRSPACLTQRESGQSQASRKLSIFKRKKEQQ